MTTLIVGQGLAGSILAINLIKAGMDVLVIDDGHKESASKVAAGLMDYISGKRLTKSWNGDTLIPFAKQYYKELESEWGESFLHESQSLRYFKSEEQVEYYEKRLKDNEYTPYLTRETPPPPYDTLVKNDFGACIIKGSAVLNTPSFLAACTTYLKKNNALLTTTFDFKDLTVLDKSVQYRDISADLIVFCEGYKVLKNPYFKDLDFRLSKGDVLTLDIPDLPQKFILNKDKWLAPFNSHFRLGATYEWNTLDCVPDPKGRKELEQILNNLLKLNYTVKNHEAGVRTASKDIRPVIGLHPDYDNVSIFNGFSSKGVMTIPYCANIFTKYIQNPNNEIPAEINCKRLFLNSKLYK
jgi:glycine oxidase